ncbi:MAG: PPC domain-containing protein, partial [Armatimonadota bacterium]|nr:PPC domain-containing protein [Armatimonadota bacterium]
LGMRIREARQQRFGAWRGAGQGIQRARQAAASAPTDRIPLPDHPLFRDLEKQSPAYLEMLARVFVFRDPKKQPNSQIAEAVRLRITIDATATPGEREIRLGTPSGFTPPLRFRVGTHPEVYEPGIFDTTPRPAEAFSLPVVFNGQIMPGEVDSFRFKARQGQGVVVRVEARSITPYLADAVPGWFQAVVSLHDAAGREVAFADDYRFDPDPVLYYRVPADGEYELRIRDALYRGRDDFVYRVTVGELPFITRIFPLGARAGELAVASVAGWNLPEKRLPLDTRPEGDRFRRAVLNTGVGPSNAVWYAVDALPERDEAEPNNTRAQARLCGLPLILNGIISRPGDVDRFRFVGRAGQDVVAEVCARRLGSPLDSLLRLTDAAGKVLAWNDDHPDKEAGLLTHDADSYLRLTLPRDGTYWVEVSDSQQGGSEAHAYRLRLGPPQPDFALRAAPSTLTLTPTGTAVLTVHALRRDGFAG